MKRLTLEGLFRRCAIFLIAAFVVATAFAKDISAQQADSPSDRHMSTLNECLLDANQMQDSEINWRRTRTRSDLEECVFAMGAELENADALNAWLKLNGFNVISPRVVPESVMQVSGINAEGVQLSGTISKGDIPLRLGIIDRFVVHSLALGIRLDDKARPVSVQATFTRK